jgi:uncharacterized membrane protein
MVGKIAHQLLVRARLGDCRRRGLAGATLRADRLIDEATVNAFPLVFHDGVEGARALLSAVAGSMITVTGVTFSVMVVAFTLASSQFTPRLLRNLCAT